MCGVRLVTVGQAAHAAHDAQHVVVGRIHVHVHGGVSTRKGTGSQSQVQHGIVNAREVAGATGLDLLRLQSEGIDADIVSGPGVSVVLVGLDHREIVALALHEAVLAVQLNLGHGSGVIAVVIIIIARNVSLVVAVIKDGVLDRPHHLLTGVVELELDLVRGGGHRLSASELELLNQILVCHLGETTTLLGIQIDVVHEQRAGHHPQLGHIVEGGRLLSSGATSDVQQILERSEIHIDLHLVILEGNQRQGQARMTIEPELQRDIQSLLRLASILILNIARSTGSTIVSSRTRNHVAVSRLDTGRQSQLIPDIQPLAVVLVNLLATDLHSHIVDQEVAHRGHPTKVTCGVDHSAVNGGQGHLDIHLGDQIAVTGDGGLYTLAKVAHTVEGLLDGLHRKVGVTTIQLLEKGHLGVSRQIHVLCAISHELHKTTGRHLYLCRRI